MKIRKKLCPLLTATGPSGHVQDFTVDLELNAARLCVYVHDSLIRESVFPLDVRFPIWGFQEKFIVVGYSLLI